MAVALLTRMEATWTYLRALQGTGAFDGAASVQADLLKRSMESIAIGIEDATRITSSIAASPLARNLQDVLLAAAVPKEAAGAEAACASTRRSLQDYRSIYKMLPACCWENLGNEKDLQGRNKTLEILNFCAKLKLHNPSEPTAQVIAACEILSNLGDRARLLSSHDKHERFVVMKKRLQSLPKVGLPEMTELPHTVEAFMIKHPTLYAAAYGTGGPAECPLDETSFFTLVGSIKIRKTAAWTAQHQGRQLAAPASHHFDANGVMMSMMSMMATCMQQQQAPRGSDDPRIRVLVPGGAKGAARELRIRSGTEDQNANDGPELELEQKRQEEAEKRQKDDAGQLAIEDKREEAAVEGGAPDAKTVEQAADALSRAIASRSKGASTAKASVKAKAKGRPKGKAAPKPKGKASPKPCKSFSHVPTRGVIEARIGKGPGSSKTFAYKAFGSKAKAEAAAKSWLATGL